MALLKRNLKRNQEFQKSLTVLALLLSSLFSAPSSAATVQSLTEGPPALAATIGDSSFVPVEVERLAHAQVWFVDYEWHRQHGIEIPPEGIRSPEFSKQVLDAYAWQSRTASDDPAAFTGEKRISYADYYGGYGLGVNLGSGRAAANGIVQAKGVKTPLAKDTDPFHSNGAVQSIEAVDEAIWSQILDGEMKHGSNKVIAVILTGTFGMMKNNHQVFPRALIIREMSPRPAHFMLNPFRFDSVEDKKRVNGTLSKLIENLPFPAGYKPNGKPEDLKIGMNEFVDREATAQAEYYAKRMYFGSVSPSNVERLMNCPALYSKGREGLSLMPSVSELSNSTFVTLAESFPIPASGRTTSMSCSGKHEQDMK